MADTFDVQPARCNIGCDQQVDLAGLERFQFALARCLIDIAMNLARTETMALQALVQFANCGLAVAEDDACRHILAADQIT